ncbi:MAG: alpha/beta fold hydrolase [Polyangiaceae bacterium]
MPTACSKHSDGGAAATVDAGTITTALGESSAQLVAFPSGALTLHGYVWRPPGAGPFPTIVFNHGSEKQPGTKYDQAQFFVSHGFALFVPHRRGQGSSSDVAPYLGDLLDGGAQDSTVIVDALGAQTDDVMAAVAYAATLPYADPKRIAVVGCSFGGIEALLAAERGTGIVAAVDFAGAAPTWKTNVPLQDRMKVAARNAKVPVFFIQARNDFDLLPSRILSEEMTTAGKPERVKIYPPNGTKPADGHAFCHGGNAPAWGDDVLDFLYQPMNLP